MFEIKNFEYLRPNSKIKYIPAIKYMSYKNIKVKSLRKI